MIDGHTPDKDPNLLEREMEAARVMDAAGRVFIGPVDAFTIAAVHDWIGQGRSLELEPHEIDETFLELDMLGLGLTDLSDQAAVDIEATLIAAVKKVFTDPEERERIMGLHDNMIVRILEGERGSDRQILSYGEQRELADRKVAEGLRQQRQVVAGRGVRHVLRRRRAS